MATTSISLLGEDLKLALTGNKITVDKLAEILYNSVSQNEFSYFVKNAAIVPWHNLKQQGRDLVAREFYVELAQLFLKVYKNIQGDN